MQDVGSRGGVRPGWPFAKGGGGRGHCMEVKISWEGNGGRSLGQKQHLEPAEFIVRSPKHSSVENRHALPLNGHQVHVPVSRLGHLESCASPRACLLLLVSLLCQQKQTSRPLRSRGQVAGSQGRA
jgi:hypothetical protein